MPEIEVGRYCGGKGKPDTIPEDPDSVVWTHSRCDDGWCGGHWYPYAVVKRTECFVFVNRHDSTTRLDREALERDGSVSPRRSWSTFYTTAAMQAQIAKDLKRSDEARQRAVIHEMTVGQRQLAMGADLDFQEVSPGVAKMNGGLVFAHVRRKETCEACGGKPDPRVLAGIKRRKKIRYVGPDHVEKINHCNRCFGRGTCEAVDNYLGRHQIRAAWTVLTGASDLDGVREKYAQEVTYSPRDNHLYVFSVAELTPMTRGEVYSPPASPRGLPDGRDA